MTSTHWPPAVTLNRDGIRLEPLALTHAEGLAAAAADGELWNLRVTSVPAPGDERAYIETALKMRAEGTRLAFAVIDETTNTVIGGTSYHDILAATKRVEIGYTWYAKSTQRSGVNTTCKLMLMAHAFDTLGCAVVGWRTDIFNFDSQRAIQKLGARRDGTIRGNALRRDGTVRDTVMYSMTADEWPEKRAKLEERLKNGGFIPSAQIGFTTESATESAPKVLTSVKLAEITSVLVGPLVRLNPGALGERMVAANGTSLMQATWSKNAKNAVPRAIMQGETPVGFVMLHDPTLAHDPDATPDALYIWRFMIDLQFQRKGLGEAAIREVFKLAAARPEFNAVTLSYVPTEGSPKPFYEKMGFRETGVEDDGELEMKISIEDVRRELGKSAD